MSTANIDIVPYSSNLAAYFTRLNLAWLNKYFVVEPIDEQMLSNPQDYIIDKGGLVFFATTGEEVVGTFALLKESDGVYELSKMAVAEDHQGKHIGNLMLAFCLNEAKRIDAHKVILYSNTKLEPALHLYRKFGFVEVPLGRSDYKRSNIKMEIELK
jgi:ribosomal protein S18 acetylase RimI-like enzyme